jgi:hypothetical protein
MLHYRDQHKGDDDCVKDFWNGCVVVHVCDNFGDLEMMNAQLVPSSKESTYYICGSSGAFGKGILEYIIYYLD